MKVHEKNPGKKNILIADDDADLMQLVKMQLQKAGFSVQLSLNGQGIAQMIAKNVPDVILLDVAMNGISGDDICKKLKSNNTTSSIPVIIFSANDNIEQIVQGCGANDFVKKPFNAQIIQDKIDHLMQV